MKILALETSCDQGSVALLCDDSTLWRTLPGTANHSRNVLSVIGQLMAEASLDFRDLDALAFGAGPGAFTGLRLACGVVQGLALGAGLGVVAVGSLEALALAGGDGLFYCATDARMGEIYQGAFEVRGETVETLVPPSCVRPEQALVLEGGGWQGRGSAFAVYGEMLEAAWTGGLKHVDAGAVPDAREVARLARARICAGVPAQAPETVGPLYIRDKVALTTAERLARGGRS